MSEMKKRFKLFRKERRIIRYELSHIDKVIIFIIGSVGGILFWKGLWILFDGFHVLADPWISISAGLLILFFTGLLIRG